MSNTFFQGLETNLRRLSDYLQSDCNSNGLHIIGGVNSRVIWPDIIRIAAIFAVIMLHAASEGFKGQFGATTFSWQVCNIYNSLCRFCVPVFVMVSGVFLLNPKKEYGINKLFCKKLLRIVTAYLFWAFFYAVIGCAGRWNNGWTRDDLHLFFFYLYNGHYHMWFLFMISGLYIITPILRQIVKNETITFYFLVLWLVWGTIKMIELLPHTRILSDTVKQFDVNLVAGFSGYFMWGYWLLQHRLPPVARKSIYLLGILSALGTAGMNGALGFMLNRTGSWLYEYTFPNVFLMATAVFVFCQYYFQDRSFSPKCQKGIALVGKWSFGIYLVHAFFLEYFEKVGFPHFFCHPIVSVPVTSIVCFSASLATVFFLSKIPVINKYIM